MMEVGQWLAIENPKKNPFSFWDKILSNLDGHWVLIPYKVKKKKLNVVTK